MNGLALRISPGGDNKSKKSIGFPPVRIPCEDSGHQVFAEAATTDEQLAILKKIVDQQRDANDTDVIKLLVTAFLQAEAKHPIKCYISRHIIKSIPLQESFSNILANQISGHIATVPTHYKQYVDVVSKVATCIENFNAGVNALRLIEISLAIYLKDCLKFCVILFSDQSDSISPTEKNEIFNLSHLALRLLLHILQKANDDSHNKLKLIFNETKFCINELMFDNDVPMDTKSVCGILYLTMHLLENGRNSWIDVLSPNNSDKSLVAFLEAEAPQLCMYSAVVTVVSAENLQTVTANNQPAIIVLMHKILEIGDRSSLESSMILAVTRTVYQMSKYLYKISDRETGLSIVDSLLIFAWSHLEHHMDSVRHLTAQMLDAVASYCANLDKEGDSRALTKLKTALLSIDKSRKSYYVSLTCLLNVLGSMPVLDTWPTLIQDVLDALSSQHIQASATTSLESLVEKLAPSCSTDRLYQEWLKVIISYIEANSLDSTVLNILEKLLVRTLRLDSHLIKYIKAYIKESSSPSGDPKNLNCVLMLLSASSKAGLSNKLASSDDEQEWKGVISYQVLREATVDAVDETRILSLSLIVECPKSTEPFTWGELDLLLGFLEYNINAQAPNFRQLTLSCMKKFMKRFEDSYKAIKRQNVHNCTKIDTYLAFLEKLRAQCFDSLLPGANYSRRCVALQLLLWTHRMHIDGYSSSWTEEYVEKLLLHLEDSYEENKRLALLVLDGCPLDLLKNKSYSISLDIKDIFAQASSLKPTDCVSAAYKLDLLTRRLPERVLGDQPGTASAPVWYSLASQLLARLRAELSVCERSVVLAARSGPMYGVLHCLSHVFTQIDPHVISPDPLWTSLVGDVIATCTDVTCGVASVVNNSSPEGHLPMDLSHVLVTDHGNSGGVLLEDGRQVSSQMVLLCAWRSVKEVSLLLGLICSRLTITGEDSDVGSLSVQQVTLVGEHFTSLLAETKHRGAFEQAYVGFTKLLARLWRSLRPSLHSLPPAWLHALLQTLAGEPGPELCATRRSAGLPFMIQALVSTELQVQSNPSCFHSCMSQLLQLASSSRSLEARSHCLNILRALFRNATLDESVAPYVGRGLVVALEGFQGDTWQERNSSTLLLSALMTRVFGVARVRGPGSTSPRNTMTGRIFFLRYPHLYDYMLKKMQESSESSTEVLTPSLYPVLLLLARLYPSALEGTVSNLKLASFVRPVRAAGAARVERTRRLAARALAPLVQPHMYIPTIQSLFSELRLRTIKRNSCHGALLQLARLLDAAPPHLDLGLEQLELLQVHIHDTLWILEQTATPKPCYIIADEYVKVLNMIAWRFPSLLHEDIISKIILRLKIIIFNNALPHAGKDVFLSNAIYLYFILTTDVTNTCDIIIKGLQHSSYDVVLSVLKYLLILHDNLDEEKCKLQEHLTSIANTTVLDTLKRNPKYIPCLCQVLDSQYLECQQKCLKVLTLEGNTQQYIIQARIRRELTIPEMTESEYLIDHLLECVRNSHDSLTHVYLESLVNFVTDKTKDNSLSGDGILKVVRLVFEYSSADNSLDTRIVLVKYIERNINAVLNWNSSEATEEMRFELKATVWSTIITLLEDDEAALRQRVAGAVTSHLGVTSRVGGACAALVRRRLARDRDGAGGALLALVALLDFRSAVVSDDGNDEFRVFDQNERYNIFLEETVWTCACAQQILATNERSKAIDHILYLFDHPPYKGTFDKLCNDNIFLFKKMLKGEVVVKSDALNPKIQLFVNMLRK